MDGGVGRSVRSLVLRVENSRRYEGHHDKYPGAATIESAGRHLTAISEGGEQGRKDSRNLCHIGSGRTARDRGSSSTGGYP